VHNGALATGGYMASTVYAPAPGSVRRDSTRPFVVSCIYCSPDSRDLDTLKLICTCAHTQTLPVFPAYHWSKLASGTTPCRQYADETLVVRSRFNRADRQSSVQLNSRSLPKLHCSRARSSFGGARIPRPGRREQFAGSPEHPIRFGRWAFSG
jgi:hypothetical protein